MGLKDLLQTKGSNLTAWDGATPPTNPLATKSSKLHANDELPGYSLDGSYTMEVTKDYNAYEDGVNNNIPMPGELDWDGRTPTILGKWPYNDNLPE